ncbi:MAG: hypothetical protein IJU76_13375 [Desulfovibrionaceae bacterium]|nr:hypothetical protein [Desulfovibrionaceae bacterium]
MTKSQRSATKKLPFAKLFRWLAIIGFIKLSIFIMILLDFPFPAALDKAPVQVRESVSVGGKESDALKRAVQDGEAAGEKKEESHASLIMPVQQSVPPSPIRAVQPNVPAQEMDQTEELFTAPDIPLPPPLPAPIAEPGTIAPERFDDQGMPKHSLPVPTLGSATVAQAAASMPVPQAIAPSQSLTPVEQQAPLARLNETTMPVPTPPARPSQIDLAAPRPTESRAVVGTDAQELARQQQDMLVLKKQMDDRIQELQDSEAKIKRMLLDARGVEGQKLKTLIQMFGNMKPKTAAKALENMDERTACKILEGLTPKQAGDILSYTNPTVTAKLTEVLTHMKFK